MPLIQLARSAILAFVAAAVMTLLPVASEAADLGEAAGAELFDRYAPHPIAHRQFYVRGDVGVGRNNLGHIEQKELSGNGGSFLVESLGDQPLIGAGFGWQLSRRFRVDITGEYRATADFKALDNLTAELLAPDGALQANTLYQGNVASYVGLLNGYWDLFSLHGFTPYIGAGIGFAHTMMSDMTSSSVATFTDAVTADQITSLTSATSRDNGRTNLAWAVMAGTSYDLSASAKLDVGYRYLNLGNSTALSSGLLNCVCGTVGSPVKASDLDAHEFRLGVRWMLGDLRDQPQSALK